MLKSDWAIAVAPTREASFPENLETWKRQL
jgi:hypothetical protein